MTEDEIQSLQVAKGILKDFIRAAPPQPVSFADTMRRYNQSMALTAALDSIDSALTMERREVKSGTGN
jgi:hypothetical protein